MREAGNDFKMTMTIIGPNLKINLVLLCAMINQNCLHVHDNYNYSCSFFLRIWQYVTLKYILSVWINWFPFKWKSCKKCYSKTEKIATFVKLKCMKTTTTTAVECHDRWGLSSHLSEHDEINNHKIYLLKSVCSFI